MDNTAKLTNNAIKLALIKNWQQAIEVNEQIIAISPQDINALNRIAYAFCQLGKLEQAKKIYKKILAIDKYNHIALKNLDRINISTPNTTKNSKCSDHINSISPCELIEQPGKTRTVILTKIAPRLTLSKLCIGNEVQLINKKYSIEIRTTEGSYIGLLPDDISFRLLILLKAGNEYTTFIKNIQKNSVTVFLIENKRGKKFANQPSFINKNLEIISSKKHKNKNRYE